MKQIRRIIKGFDMFGAPVHLQLKKGKQNHNTVLGGSVSLLSYILLLAYTSVLLTNMIEYKSDRIMTKPFKQDTNSTKLSDMRISTFNFLVYNHPNGSMIPVKYDNSAKQYIKVIFS